jgi:hypothetical protein
MPHGFATHALLEPLKYFAMAVLALGIAILFVAIDALEKRLPQLAALRRFFRKEIARPKRTGNSDGGREAKKEGT